MKMEADIRVLLLQAEELHESPEAARGGEDPSPRDFGGSEALLTPRFQTLVF